jgi:hypothetical protein
MLEEREQISGRRNYGTYGSKRSRPLLMASVVAGKEGRKTCTNN